VNRLYRPAVFRLSHYGHAIVLAFRKFYLLMASPTAGLLTHEWGTAGCCW